MKKSRTTHKLPFEPLRTMFVDGTSDARIAEAIDKHCSVINRWKRKGLPIYTADKIACHIGVHPSHIWGEEWWTASDLEN